MGFEMRPQTLEYRDHTKVCGSGIEVDSDVARRRWSADGGLRAQGRDRRAGSEIVEDRKRGACVRGACDT
jgi:hypothetical protein